MIALAMALIGYTRLAPSELLDLPRRKTIVELVSASPGIHLRELHRALGGGWGGFETHVRTLARARQLRLQRAGGVVEVYPAGHAPPKLALHPTTREVLARVPAQGEVVIADLAASLSMSPQLVRYHVKKLVAAGQLDAERLHRER